MMDYLFRHALSDTPQTSCSTIWMVVDDDKVICEIGQNEYKERTGKPGSAYDVHIPNQYYQLIGTLLAYF